MTNATVEPKTIANRFFGDASRYRLQTFHTRYNTVEFFLWDAEKPDEEGKPSLIAQSNSLSAVLSYVDMPARSEFLCRLAHRRGQIIKNLDHQYAKVIRVMDSGDLKVKCVFTGDIWIADREKCVLIG